MCYNIVLVKYERTTSIIFSPLSIMSKKGGVRFHHTRRNKSARKSTLKVRPIHSAYNRSVKLRSLSKSYPSESRLAAFRAKVAAKAQRKIERVQAEAQREMERFARRARGENSNNDDAPHASHAAASVAENRSMRAAIRSLAAFGNLGEQLPRASTRKQPRNKMSDK